MWLETVVYRIWLRRGVLKGFPKGDHEEFDELVGVATIMAITVPTT